MHKAIKKNQYTNEDVSSKKPPAENNYTADDDERFNENPYETASQILRSSLVK